jgi:amidase
MTSTMVDAAAGISGADVLDLLETAQLIGRRTAAWHDKGFDLLVMASTPDVAPPLGTLQAAADDDVRRATKALLPLVSLLGWCNLTGQPAISLPLSTSPTGMPIGIQLVAPYGREDCSPSPLNSKSARQHPDGIVTQATSARRAPSSHDQGIR